MSDLTDALALLDDADPAHFTNAAWWEHAMIPALGLNDEHRHEMPPELAGHMGKGLRIWQYPNQFGYYLARIATLAPTIDRYIEIGTRHGGTFIVTCEILRRLNPDFMIGWAVDLIDRPPLLVEYCDEIWQANYWQADSREPNSVDHIQDFHWGLALIDGDHSYDGAKHDYDTLKGCTANIAFHDIASDACPGVRRLWWDITRTDHTWKRVTEWTHQYNSVSGRYMGIGLLESR